MDTFYNYNFQASKVWHKLLIIYCLLMNKHKHIHPELSVPHFLQMDEWPL